MAATHHPTAEPDAPEAEAAHASSLAIHRVRFVNWAPSTVTALAVSPSFAGAARGLLAIGRQNGNIELCTWIGPRAAQKSDLDDRAFQSDAAGWAVHTVLPGQLHSKIQHLCFANPPTAHAAHPHKLRLFSISGGSILTEHFIPLHLAKLAARRGPGADEDGDTAKPPRPGSVSALFGKRAADDLDPHYPGETRTLPSLAGAVWSMAPSATGRFLALGCEDGSVKIIDLQNDRFEHLAATSGQDRRIAPRFGKAKGKVISLCWGPPVRAPKRNSTRNQTRPTQHNSDDESDSSDDSDDSDDSSDDDDDDDQDDAQWHESFVVGGLAQSTAVVWDAATGSIATKLALHKNRSESTIVWSVATLPDGGIVAGDSTGRVTFFDARTRLALGEGTFRAHAASSDVLALCVGPDGRTVYSAGVDQKVAEYTRIDAPHGRARWIHVASRRLHAHDIRALAIDPPYSPLDAAQALAARASAELAPARLPVLLSGGVDFNLVLTPAAPPSAVVKAQRAATLAQMPKSSRKPSRETLTRAEQEAAAINPISSNPLTTFADTTQRRVPFVPTAARAGLLGGGCVAALCASKRWIVLRREQSIGIWDLGSADELERVARAADAGEATPPPAWAKLLEMELRVESNLISVAISADGRFLAASDVYETKLFELKQRPRAAGPVELEPRKVKSFARAFGGGEAVAPAASALRFSPDSTRLVVASLTGAYVHVLELPSTTNDAACRLLRSFGHHRRAATAVDQRQLAGRVGNGANGANGANGVDGYGDKREGGERTVSGVIQHAEISWDGAWLSTISSDLQHHVYSLDSLTYGRRLPSPSSVPSGVVFYPSTSARTSSLVTLVFADNKLEFWDVESGLEMSSLGQDGRKRGAAEGGRAKSVGRLLAQLKQALQLRLAGVRDFAVGAVWCADPAAELVDSTLVIYGATWIATARTTRTDPTVSSEDVEMTDVESRSDVEWSVRTTAKYQPLLLVAQLATPSPSPHLVVLERPYFELAKHLPPAFHRGARYGA